MRIATIVLAVVTAVGQLLLFVYAEAQLDVEAFGQLAGNVAPRWSRTMWAVGWTLPWVIGAAMLAFGPVRSGTAVVVTVALLSLADLAGVVRLGAAAVDASDGQTETVVRASGVALVWVTGVAAGVAAWMARPRGEWRTGAPGPVGLFVAAAIAAWLPTAFHSTAFAPPGAPRRFLEPLASTWGMASAEQLLYPVVVAAVLLGAPRLRPTVGGAVTLTFAVPQLVSHVAVLRAAIGEDMVIPTPAGVLGLVGVVALVVLGIVWLTRGRALVSDVSTDRGPPEEG